MGYTSFQTDCSVNCEEQFYPTVQIRGRRNALFSLSIQIVFWTNFPRIDDLRKPFSGNWKCIKIWHPELDSVLRLNWRTKNLPDVCRTSTNFFDYYQTNLHVVKITQPEHSAQKTVLQSYLAMLSVFFTCSLQNR